MPTHAGRRQLALCLLGLLTSASACSRDHGAAATPTAPVPVTVAVVQQKPMPVEARAIGNVAATISVTVRPRVGGTVAKVHMREGEDVREGDLLFTLDRRPLEAELRQAEANLARSSAQLANAQRDAARYAELVKRGFIAEQEYDKARTNAVALEATVRADRAVVENAKVQVEYTLIRAPISGRAGALLVHEGDLAVANTTALVVINQLRPIDVAFALPEPLLPDVQRYRAQGSLRVDALAPSGGQMLARGQVTFLDNRVDQTTGTIQLKATFPNEDRLLWPGQFVNVLLTLTTDPAAIVVPAAAVQTGQDGRYVFVVRPDQTVESRPVTVAREVGAEAVVQKGVSAGEVVVTEGQLRLTPGIKVQVAAATGSPAPRQ
jgi:multidrug efflux system membrane fusion protein